MDGPRNRARRYLAPVRRDVGLNVVWNIEHRSRFRACTCEGKMDAMPGRRQTLTRCDCCLQTDEGQTQHMTFRKYSLRRGGVSHPSDRKCYGSHSQLALEVDIQPYNSPH